MGRSVCRTTIMLPSPDILNEFQHGKFVLSNLAAKRANQLREGAMPLVRIESNHPLTIALAEIAAGKIRPILQEHDAPDLSETVEMSLISDEPLPAELGMLLPALDEVEASLVSPLLSSDEEVEDLHDLIPDAMSLTDLAVEDEEEIVPTPGDDEPLSLTDIAEQETTLEDEEPEE